VFITEGLKEVRDFFFGAIMILLGLLWRVKAMANEEHLAILRQGVDVWNKWRDENLNIVPDLREVDLREANLIEADLSSTYLKRANLSMAHLGGANLEDADLREVNLIGADLNGADLIGADLNGSDLFYADLIGAELYEVNLSGVNLGGANLRGANLSGAILVSANLSRANLSGSLLEDADFHRVLLLGTLFADVDLSTAKGLETVDHYGPSTIGIDTLYKSRGKIPEVFLRGCGVPEEFIRNMPYFITGKAIQFYSCFISYSTKDQEFAMRLHADLLSKGVRCWFAPEDIKGGRKLHEQIPEAIRLHDKLLLVLSENSMQSEWVKTEIYHARQDEIKDNCRKLFPIGLAAFGKIKEWQAFDADTGKDMAREIREYFIPDFSNWKDQDAYKEAFERLMRDLNLEGKG
jgi:hypothetical protein